MAIAWIRKSLSTVSPPDNVFKKNFMKEFLNQLKEENPSASFPRRIFPRYLHNIDHPPPDFRTTASKVDEIDFSQVCSFIRHRKSKKRSLN